MNKRNVVNLALLAAVAVLVALVVFEPGKEAPPEPPTLTNVAPESINRIRIERKGRGDVDLMRKDDRWQVQLEQEDRWVPANAFKIKNLLRVLQTTSHARFVPASGELDKYGLTEPRARLQLDGVEIAFGDTEPLNNRRYVLVGDTVHLIDDAYYQHIAAERTDFVDKSLLPGNPRIAAITLPEITLSLEENGRWQISPEQQGLSADAITGFVDEWRYAQALSVRPYEGKATANEVAIRLKDDREIRFIIVAREPELILARPELGIQYHFSSQTAQRLFDPAAHQPPEPAEEPAPAS